MRQARLTSIVVAVVVLVLAGGCATSGPRWPAISATPTDVHVQGRWVWGELFADNVETEKTFYREVFGWDYESHGTGKEAYTLVRVNDRPIAGILHYARPADAARSARWLPFMSVPDVARAAGQAERAEGRVLVPPRELSGRGTAAVLADPEGALFGVIDTTGGDPPDTFPTENAWFWLELWAKDASRMADFYSALGAYSVTRQEGPRERTELHLAAGGFPRAGILEIERRDIPSAWLPYVRVKDLQQTVSAIENAGGRIIVAPSPDIRNGKVAVFLDPLGAAAAVVEWKDEHEGEGRP